MPFMAERNDCLLIWLDFRFNFSSVGTVSDKVWPAKYRAPYWGTKYFFLNPGVFGFYGNRVKRKLKLKNVPNHLASDRNECCSLTDRCTMKFAFPFRSLFEIKFGYFREVIYQIFANFALIQLGMMKSGRPRKSFFLRSKASYIWQ